LYEALRFVSRVAIVLVASWSVSACAVLSWDGWTWNQRGISSDVAEVRIERSPDGYITHVSVHSEDGVTTIKGAARWQATACADCSAEIHVVVISADAQIVEELEMATRGPMRRRNRPGWTGWFDTKLPYEMEPGMAITLQYHAVPTRSENDD
jgi:hypothetical protein